jgi:HD-like signal output (HDOD) protein
MESPTASVTDVAKIVIRDPGLAAKLLQLVNSAYFGTGQATTSIQQAVALLGTDRLRYIALTASVFASQQLEGQTDFSLEQLQRESMRAAWLARSFADPSVRDEAFTSTLLHDVGRVVLAICRGDAMSALHDRVARGESSLAVELDLFGVTHADVGARLLAIWGLPTAIVDVVQYHHDPGSAPEPSRRLAAIVHVADAMVHGHGGGGAPELDLESLGRAGCAHLADGWLATPESDAL